MRTLIAFGLITLLAACTGSQSQPQADVAEVIPADWPTPVGKVSLNFGSPVPAVSLDVAVVVFDPGIPEDESTHRRLNVFPDIRRAEARYQSVVLRDVLTESNRWGAVRVVPHASSSSSVSVTATIVHSDGEDLVLDVLATDASGRTWLEKRYRDASTESDFPVNGDDDPFIDLYNAVANDLALAGRAMPAGTVNALPRVTELRYAETLSPEAFSGYLAQDAQGQYSLQRLPAEGDPMLARVQRIQNQEFLFIDTVDEQYVDLYNTMGPVYHLWRQYEREQAVYKREYQVRASSRESHGRRGTYAQMMQTYSAFRSVKIQQQDLLELAGGFNNEVAPTVLAAGDRVVRLNGTLDTQYDEWRDILRQIFALESGLPPAAP